VSAIRKQAIRASRVITPLEDIPNGTVLVDGERIEAVIRSPQTPVSSDYRVWDVGDRILAPGLIDIHNHGAVGHFAREGPDAVRAISRWLVTTGTTSWLPTAGDLDGVRGVVEAIDAPGDGAMIEGIHNEGAFLFPKYLPGESEAPPPRADVGTYRGYLEAADGHLRLMDVSPDLPGALDVIRAIRASGVVASFCHGDADYELFLQAVDAGVTHVTHVFNVMTGLHHRRPGAVGAALTLDSLMCELNADGHHVHPVAMDIAIRCKGLDNVCLISDMQAAAGLPDGDYDWSDRIIDGEYDWTGVQLVKRGGVVRLRSVDPALDGTISSSVWPVIHGVWNLVHLVGLPLKDALRLASLNPAVAVGIEDRVGSIAPGKRADFVVIDEDVRLFATIVAGEERFRDESGVPADVEAIQGA
jgi:N-acetylglucosamine-6-phosphate deacetylase